MHILGFDSCRYSHYLDPATGDTYAYPIISSSPETLNPNRDPNYILKTPYVTEWAQDFFDCLTLTGMAL